MSIEAMKQIKTLEPYAYAYVGIHIDNSCHGPHLCWRPEYMDSMSASKGAVAVPLYTTPPRLEWVGLTDAEVGALTVFEGLHHVEVPILAEFIRVIEAKLKEKNA